MGGVVVVAAIIALLATGGPASDGALAYGTVTVSGTPLPEPGDGTDQAVGMPIPEVRGQAFDGSPLQIGPTGRPLTIAFLAHWCSHCQAEVQALSAWFRTNGFPEGVDLVSVATLTDPTLPNYPPATWLEREGWSLPVLVDDEASSASGAFGLTGTPFWVLVNSDGTVAARVSGEVGVPGLTELLSNLH